MSKKKSDLQRLIEKYDEQITALEAQIESVKASRQTAQDVIDEKAILKAKAARAKAPKVPKASKKAQTASAETQADPFVGVQ